MVGNRLKDKRSEIGASKAEMARRLGMTAQTYEKIEQNEEIPSIQRVTEIAKALDCSVEYLLSAGTLPQQPATSLGKYLKKTKKGFVCTAKHCEWRDRDGFCHSGAGCLKERLE